MVLQLFLSMQVFDWELLMQELHDEQFQLGMQSEIAVLGGVSLAAEWLIPLTMM